MRDQPLRCLVNARLSDVINAVGSWGFGPLMAGFADSVFGGHVCFAYHYQSGCLSPLAAGHVPPDITNVLVPNTWRYTHGREWERDACFSQAMSQIENGSRTHLHDRRGVASKRYWPWQIPTPLVDKVVLCERVAQEFFVLEFSRWGECAEFDAQAIDGAVETGRTLMALTVMHRRMLTLRTNPIGALRSSSEIEHCLAAMSPLTHRERQVCVRQLLGVKMGAIAEELGIGQESAKSYRKRAYLRLKVASERELILKYLCLRAAWRGHPVDSDAPLDPWHMPFLLAT